MLHHDCLLDDSLLPKHSLHPEPHLLPLPPLLPSPHDHLLLPDFPLIHHADSPLPSIPPPLLHTTFHPTLPPHLFHPKSLPLDCSPPPSANLIDYLPTALHHDVHGPLAGDFLSTFPPAVTDTSPCSFGRSLELLRKDEFSSLPAELQKPLEVSPVMAAQQHLFGSFAPAVSPTWKSPTTRVSSSAHQASVDTLSTKTNFDDHADQNQDEEAGENDDDIDESGDGSGVLYDTDDAKNLEARAAGVFVEKGKGKKGPPAKNLMAERRRRKKLNDRLYTLRSVVPKISKMDRASILGDAIEYLKELLQRINDLHNELEASPAEKPPLLQCPPSLQSLTPSSPFRLTKEECPHSTTSPDTTQPPKVEVRTREGRALNIHMFCARRPGLLLSTMRALDGLGLDVQQAVISCFNGFALDVFRAEQSVDCEVAAEEIKRVLLLTASAHGGP